MSRLWKRCIVVLIRDYSFNVRCLFFSFVYFISYFKSTYLGTEDFWAGLSPRSWPQELVFRRGAWIDKEILDKELCVLVKCTAIRTSSCARPCMISPNDRFGSRDIFIAQLLHCDPPLRQSFAIILNDQCKMARPCKVLENRFSSMQLDHFAQGFGNAIGRHQVIV